MPPRGPAALAALLLLLLFSAARLAAADASGPAQQDFREEAGGWVLFPVRIPPGARVAELFLRTTLDKKAVALWRPGKLLDVLDGRFSGRVRFSEAPGSFNLSGLRLADGELYQVSISPGEPAETVIHAYRLSVFNISATASKLDNDSCSLALLCQAGMGPGTGVSYTWKAAASGSVLARGPRLQALLDPSHQDASYTCKADQDAFQSQWDVAPYREFCSSGVAGLSLGKALFVPLLATLLVLP